MSRFTGDSLLGTDLEAIASGSQVVVESSTGTNTALLASSDTKAGVTSAQQHFDWEQAASKAATALQSGDNITELTNNAPYLINAPVDTVFGRLGAILAQVGDYDSFYPLLGHTHTESDITDLEHDARAIYQDAVVLEAAGVSVGQLVYIAGASGGLATVSLADKTSPSMADVIGIARTSGADGATIEVATSGRVEDLNTSGFIEGEVIYLGLAGAFTKTHPVGVESFIRVGHIVSAHATLGVILFNVESLTLTDDYDGLIRHTVVNQNAGISSAASSTMINDAGHRSSVNMVGSNYSLVAGLADSFVMYNQGYNKSVFAIAGNYGFDWSVDINNGHDLGFVPIMNLSPAGDLTLNGTVDGRDVAADGIALDAHIPDAQLHILDAGWRDNIQTFTASNGGGTTPPTWNNMGNGMYGWEFTTGDELFVSFHIDHDYKLGSDAFPHVHFMVTSTMTAGQQITWNVGYVKARGHHQGDSFLGGQTLLTLQYIADGTEVPGEHLIVECSLAQAFDLLEPDTMVLVRVEMVSENVSGKIYGLACDIHYQVDRYATPNKSPDFYI
jgi:hypothetical protein